VALQNCHECGGSVSTEAVACPACGAPVKRRIRKSHAVPVLFGLVGAVLVFNAVVSSRPSGAAVDATAPKPAVAQEPDARKDCNARLLDIKRVYSQLMAENNFAGAAIVARTCAETLSDPILREMTAKAEQEGFLSDIANAKLPDRDRLNAITGLKNYFPEIAAARESQLAPVRAALTKAVEREDANREAIMATVRKKQWWEACIQWGRDTRSGAVARAALVRDYLLSDNTANHVDVEHLKSRQVKLGMTACGVYAMFGMPDDVNSTTTSSSESTQIVYRDRGLYVYTEARPNDGNGIVRSIQH
jgi:hypothetical protein